MAAILKENLSLKAEIKELNRRINLIERRGVSQPQAIRFARPNFPIFKSLDEYVRAGNDKKSMVSFMNFFTIRIQ